MINFFKKRIWFRTLIQVFFLLLTALISINHAMVESGKAAVSFLSSASLHALCPFGGVETFYTYISSGSLVPKIHISAFILMLIGIVLAILFGPVICGWFCSLGSVQEWLGMVGKKLFKKRYNNFIPVGVDRILRYARYLILVMVVYNTATMVRLAFLDIDPYFALFNFWSSETTTTSLIVLGVTLTGSLFVERPWCKYACPYGAFLGIFNLFRVFKIRRTDATCIHCEMCTRRCPMNIPVSKVDRVLDHQCISCLECTSEAVCPVAATVDFAVAGGGK